MRLCLGEGREQVVPRSDSSGPENYSKATYLPYAVEDEHMKSLVDYRTAVSVLELPG